MQARHTPDAFVIRAARESDLSALVQVHVTSWNNTYPDYFPKPTSVLRTYQWQQAFAEKEDRWFCYVATGLGDIIAGFATGNDFADPNLPYKGQLNKIHLLKAYQRMGLGCRLVGQVAGHFLQDNIRSMILFADPGNTNIAFYDALGGKRLLDKDGTFQGAFGWEDLEKLATLCSSNHYK